MKWLLLPKSDSDDRFTHPLFDVSVCLWESQSDLFILRMVTASRFINTLYYLIHKRLGRYSPPVRHGVSGIGSLGIQSPRFDYKKLRMRQSATFRLSQVTFHDTTTTARAYKSKRPRKVDDKRNSRTVTWNVAFPLEESFLVFMKITSVVLLIYLQKKRRPSPLLL